MRAVVQRVSQGAVSINNEIVGMIGKGLVVLLGVGKNDIEQDAKYLAGKIVHLRIFEDDNGKMNRSVLDIEGELLVVSQFTLYGDCRKGRRPSFSESAPPEEANRLYEYFVEALRSSGLKVQTGVFQAYMEVDIKNDGPVTLIIESLQED